MMYRIANLETGVVVFTDDRMLATRCSFEPQYDVEIVESNHPNGELK